MLIQQVELNFPELKTKPSNTKTQNDLIILCFGITGVYLIQPYICYV